MTLSHVWKKNQNTCIFHTILHNLRKNWDIKFNSRFICNKIKSFIDFLLLSKRRDANMKNRAFFRMLFLDEEKHERVLYNRTIKPVTKSSRPWRVKITYKNVIKCIGNCILVIWEHYRKTLILLTCMIEVSGDNTGTRRLHQCTNTYIYTSDIRMSAMRHGSWCGTDLQVTWMRQR